MGPLVLLALVALLCFVLGFQTGRQEANGKELFNTTLLALLIFCPSLLMADWAARWALLGLLATWAFAIFAGFMTRRTEENCGCPEKKNDSPLDMKPTNKDDRQPKK